MIKGFDGNMESEKYQSSVDKRGPTLGENEFVNVLAISHSYIFFILNNFCVI